MKTIQILTGAMLLTAASVLAVTNTTNRNLGGHSTTLNVPSGVLNVPSGVITNMPSGVLHKPSGVVARRQTFANTPSTVVSNPPDDIIGDSNPTNQPAQPAQ